MAMEFWGVEVKHGESVRVDPGEDMIVHISQAALGENKKNENDSIRLYLKVGDQKLTIGVLSHEKFPQLSTEIVLERGFELSHSWKNGSVFFAGYKVDASDGEADNMTDDELAVASDKGTKQVNFQLPNEDVKATEDDSDDSDEESEDAGDEKEKKAIAEGDSSDDDEEDSSDEEEDDSSEDDEDDSSEEETPKKKPEETKKRSAEASKNTASNKKAKFVTPQKTTETKKPYVHIATPYPSKQASKGPGSSNGEASKQQQQTPKSAGAYGCKSCKRTFTTEMGLQSHTKAKHSAAA